MKKFYNIISEISLWTGLFFLIMEVVYGYFFHGWHIIIDSMSREGVWIYNTKDGETILFGFLCLSCFLLSISASLLAKTENKN